MHNSPCKAGQPQLGSRTSFALMLPKPNEPRDRVPARPPAATEGLGGKGGLPKMPSAISSSEVFGLAIPPACHPFCPTSPSLVPGAVCPLWQGDTAMGTPGHRGADPSHQAQRAKGSLAGRSRAVTKRGQTRSAACRGLGEGLRVGTPGLPCPPRLRGHLPSPSAPAGRD